MSPAAVQDLHMLLNWVRERRGARQFIFCSGSMGGTGNLIYAVRHPEDVAGVVALCPATDLGSYCDWAARGDRPVLQEIATAICASYGGTPTACPEVYAEHSALGNADRLTMPLAIVHGDADLTIPVDQSRDLVGRLRENRADVCYKEIPGGGHDAPIPDFGSALLEILKQLA